MHQAHHGLDVVPAAGQQFFADGLLSLRGRVRRDRLPVGCRRLVPLTDARERSVVQFGSDGWKYGFDGPGAQHVWVIVVGFVLIDDCYM